MTKTHDPGPTWRDALRQDGPIASLLDLPPDQLQELREYVEALDARGLHTADILLTLATDVHGLRGIRATSRDLPALRRWDARFQRARRRLSRDLAQLTELMQQHRPPFTLVHCADCQTPGSIATHAAWTEAEAQAAALARALAALPDDLLPVFRNPRGRLRRADAGNPERALIGETRRRLTALGVPDAEQDDLLRLVGLLPPARPRVAR